MDRTRPLVARGSGLGGSGARGSGLGARGSGLGARGSGLGARTAASLPVPRCQFNLWRLFVASAACRCILKSCDMAERSRATKDLEVWQGGMELCLQIYELVERLPSSENVSSSHHKCGAARCPVPSNIAEGHARRQPKPFLNHVHIALGSLAELETCLVIAWRLKFITEEQFRTESKEARALGRCCTASPDRLNGVERMKLGLTFGRVCWMPWLRRDIRRLSSMLSFSLSGCPVSSP